MTIADTNKGRLTITYLLFGLFNLICLVMIISILFYANTYLNAALIPDSLMWEGGKPTDNNLAPTLLRGVILLFEAIVLISGVYILSKLFLRKTGKGLHSYKIAKRTAGLNLGIIVLMIVYLMYILLQ